MNYTIVRDGLSVLKKYPNTALVTFPEHADDERTAAQDIELQQLVEEKDVTLFDLSGSKSVETSWLRLITTLTVTAMRQHHKIVGVVGASAQARSAWDYIGQLKNIYEFPTIEAAIEGTRPITQEQLLAGRLTNEEHRRELLASHYHNALLYSVKLRDALEKIKQAAELDQNPDEKIAQLAKEALQAPHPEAIMAKRQSERLRAQYGDNMFHGHPYPEYLHLPMNPTDEYCDPFKPPTP